MPCGPGDCAVRPRTHGTVSVGEHHQRPGIGAFGELRQDLERTVIGAVRVVDHQHHTIPCDVHQPMNRPDQLMAGERHLQRIGWMSDGRQPRQHRTRAIVQLLGGGRHAEQQLLHHCTQGGKGIVGCIGKHESSRAPSLSRSFDHGVDE